MVNLFRFYQHFFISYRLKSTSKSSKMKQGEIIKKLNKENKLVFGKLLETSVKKIRRLQRLRSDGQIKELPEEYFSDPELKYFMEFEQELRIVNKRITTNVDEINNKSELNKNNVSSLDNNLCKNTILSSNVDDLQKSNITVEKKAVKCNKIHVSEVYRNTPLINVNKPEYSPNNLTLDIVKKINFYNYPSVTVILSKTKSKHAELTLKHWEEKLISELGVNGFKKFFTNQLQLGSTLRKLILDRLKGASENKLNIQPELMGYWKSLSPVFSMLTKINVTERISVHHNLRYKGMIDCIAEFRDKPVLVCWKKSDRLKTSLDMTYDTPLQIAAYIGAINFDSSYPFRVEEALLIMSYNDGVKADIFHINKEKCLDYWKLWLLRLHAYQTVAKTAGVDSIPCDKLMIEENNKIKTDNQVEVSIETKEKGHRIEIDDQPKVIVHALEKSQYGTVIEDTVKKRNNPETPKIDYEILKLGKINEDMYLGFPLFNNEKREYFPNESYDLNAVKESRLDSWPSYPAVTVVLRNTLSESAKVLLDRWRQNLISELGIEGFEEFSRNLLGTGKTFHKLIQDYMLGTSEENLNIPTHLEGSWKSVKPVLSLLPCVKLIESNIVHEILQYKGIVDCVAEFRGKLVVIDWKKSDKLKSSIEMTYDAPLQIAAYIGAINFDKNYPFKVEEALLVISYTDGTKADVFHITKEKCSYYWNLWLQRLLKYKINLKKNDLRISY